MIRIEHLRKEYADVTPLKDVNAAAVAVAHGWKTDAQVAADYGCDIDDNLEEAARVAELRKQYGLPEPQLMNTPTENGGKDKGGKDGEAEKAD